jgi:hypothetical protein
MPSQSQEILEDKLNDTQKRLVTFEFHDIWDTENDISLTHDSQQSNIIVKNMKPKKEDIPVKFKY